MGRMLAYALVLDKHSVTLFDQQPRNTNTGCSFAAAGLLMPVSELDKSDIQICLLGREAVLSYWPGILKEIGGDIYFRSLGALALSHPRDITELRRFISLVESKLSQFSGVIKNRQRKDSSENTRNQFTVKLDQKDIRQIEPDLVSYDEIYFIPEEGQIDSQAVMLALEEYLNRHKIHWCPDTVVLSVANGSIHTNKGNHSFDLVFDCRGLGAGSLFKNMLAVRGECIWLYAPEVRLRYPVRFHHPRYNLYVVPRPGSVYIVGASEIYSEDYSNISVRSTLELLTAAYSLHAGFAEARIIKTVTHCRPALMSFLPEIRLTNQCVAINGLYRHGFLIAPSLAMEIMRWINQGLAAREYPQLWSTIS